MSRSGPHFLTPQTFLHIIKLMHIFNGEPEEERDQAGSCDDDTVGAISRLYSLLLDVFVLAMVQLNTSEAPQQPIRI